MIARACTVFRLNTRTDSAFKESENFVLAFRRDVTARSNPIHKLIFRKIMREEKKNRRPESLGAHSHIYIYICSSVEIIADIARQTIHLWDNYTHSVSECFVFLGCCSCRQRWTSGEHDRTSHAITSSSLLRRGRQTTKTDPQHNALQIYVGMLGHYIHGERLFLSSEDHTWTTPSLVIDNRVCAWTHSKYCLRSTYFIQIHIYVYIYI